MMLRLTIVGRDLALMILKYELNQPGTFRRPGPTSTNRAKLLIHGARGKPSESRDR